MGTTLQAEGVAFYPFTIQAGPAEAVLGRPEVGVFISVPLEALEVIELLQSGLSQADAQEAYAARHGEIPDIADLVTELTARGFVASPSARATEQRNLVPPSLVPRRSHFTGIPVRWARAVFSAPVIGIALALVAAAIAAVVLDPSIVPGRTALLFTEQISLSMLLFMAGGILMVFLHEMAHLVAARSRGVSCSLAISNRLWVPVAETDMTGLWTLPRRERYLPILAGPLLDATFASILVLVLAANRHALLAIGPAALRFLNAALLGYLLALAWQCFLFVRTDFYYVYATLFDCKNLMADTRTYLLNLALRALGRRPAQDQSHIPAPEIKAIRAYAPLWILGRAFALYILVTLVLPLLGSYLLRIVHILSSWRDTEPRLLVDALTVLVSAAAFQLWGFWLWIRSLRDPLRRSR